MLSHRYRVGQNCEMTTKVSPMPRVLLVAATTGYQIRAFGDAADILGVELVFATDRCHILDDPWRDSAIPVRFHDEASSVRSIIESAVDRSIEGVVAVGDRPAVIAALAAHSLAVRGSSPEAVRVAGNKLMTRVRLHEAHLPCPSFCVVPADTTFETLLRRVTFPCVVKPLALTASRGVMRADTPEDLDDAMTRLRSLLEAPDVRGLRDPANETILVEDYIPGREIAIEAVLTDGALHVLAIFDKPDPLEGPFFEETIYVTPADLSGVERRCLLRSLEEALTAIGLTNGPIHAECRVNDRGVFVLEVAARPIGGLCARSLRFSGPTGRIVSLEELVLRHALGQPVSGYCREVQAAGVMMIPIPSEGLYKGVTGLEGACATDHIEEVIVTAKPDQHLHPLPEGSSYLGFIVARANGPSAVVTAALRTAHQHLRFEIEPSIPVIQ